MKIIIAGAGGVGFHLAKLLSYESLDVILIDSFKEKLKNAEQSLDIKTIHGDASSINTLEEAQVSEADLVIAVTSVESTNILTCIIAKNLGGKKTLARITNAEYTKKNKIKFSNLGVDDMILTEMLASNEIKNILEQSEFDHLYQFEKGKLTLVGVTLGENCPSLGKSIKEIALQFPDVHFIPIVIKRKDSEDSIIPRGDTKFELGDNVFFITLKKGVKDLCKIVGTKHEVIKRAIIFGGNRLGLNIAKKLTEEKIAVTIFEKDKDKALNISENTDDNVMVINADGRNMELLEEEGLNETDAYIAVTEDSENNIMSCFMAKLKGVKKIISVVENMDYIQLSQHMGIDSVINKKLLTANTIFKYIRKGDIVDMTTLNNFNVQILEFIVKDNSKVNNMKIMDIDFPRAAIIGGVYRNKKGIIALGDFIINTGDRIIVCCLPEAIKKIESLML